jgi:hypothetical protein
MIEFNCFHAYNLQKILLVKTKSEMVNKLILQSRTIVQLSECSFINIFCNGLHADQTFQIV